MRLCKDWISTYFNSIHSSLKLFRSQIQRLPTSLPTVRILRHIQLLQGKSASLKRCASVPSMYHCLKCQPAPPICCLCSGTSPPSLQMIESFEATSTSTKFIWTRHEPVMQITRRHGRSVVWKFTDRCTTCSWVVALPWRITKNDLDAGPELCTLQNSHRIRFKMLQAIRCSCLLFKLSKASSAQKTRAICYSALIKPVKPVLCTLIWAYLSYMILNLPFKESRGSFQGCSPLPQSYTSRITCLHLSALERCTRSEHEQDKFTTETITEAFAVSAYDERRLHRSGSQVQSLCSQEESPWRSRTQPEIKIDQASLTKMKNT